jgi:urease gamma subunit
MAGLLARERRARGVKLNHPEAAVILLERRPDRDAVGVTELAGPGAVWRRLG